MKPLWVYLLLGASFSLRAQVPLPDAVHTASPLRSDRGTTQVLTFPGLQLVDYPMTALPDIYKNIRFADVDGDGLPDMCYLDANLDDPPTGGGGIYIYGDDAVVKCALGSYTKGPHAAIQFGNPSIWSDPVRYADPSHWPGDSIPDGMFEFADVNGDGKADLCVLEGLTPSDTISWGEVSCITSSGSEFWGHMLWAQIANATSIRLVDINHDGKTDLCVRFSNGINCAISNGTDFLPFILVSSDFSDAAGWNNPAYWQTIQFADLNGDGRMDVCGRGSLGMVCALNQPVVISPGVIVPGFARAGLWTTQYADAIGWNQPQYYSTIRLADINGDGKADICGRGTYGYYCALSTGSAFDYAWNLQLPEFSDAAGWNQEARYKSLWFVDVSGDGKADLCGRGSTGIVCAVSTSFMIPSFAPSQLWVNNFGDNLGWGDHDYYWGTVTPIYANRMKAFCGRSSFGILCSDFFFKATL